MTKPQVIYLVILFVYLCLFFLFSRYFYYRYYSQKHHWRKRPLLSRKKVVKLAAALGKELPHFCIMIPAKNEAAVIEKTLNHMSQLDYPTDKYQVIVVTDQKELNEQRTEMNKTIAELSRKLTADQPAFDETERVLVLAALSRIFVSKSNTSWRRFYSWLLPNLRETMTVKRQEELLVSLANEIVRNRGKVPERRLYKIFSIICPQLSRKQVQRVYPQFLALTLPLLAAFWELARQDPQEYRTIVASSTRVRERLSREVLCDLAALVGGQVLAAFSEEFTGSRRDALLRELYRTYFPTTQDVVERWRSEHCSDAIPELKHYIVPVDFDGKYEGSCVGYPVKSTKGRALNFALPHLPEQAAMCGFYDAESRPDQDILLHVAYNCLKKDTSMRILQGPIFQVRNFFEMSPLSKVASLYQSVAHDWALPVTYKTIPFVGGTNVFVSTDLIKQLRGYDPEILTEDLEFGTRAYLAADVWPEYLPCATSEQTPPVFRAFYRQRLRWGTGHLQVIDKIRNSDYPAQKKRRLLRNLYIKGPVEWTFYQCASFLPPTVLILYAVGLIDPSAAPLAAKLMLHIMTTTYLGFTYYCYYRYNRYLDRASAPEHTPGRVLALAQLLYLPIAAFFFPVPFSSALVLKRFGRHPTTWTKTPRTQE